MRKITVALAGLGSRGKDTYAKTAKLFPEKMKITAIADINPEKVKEVAEEYQIPKEFCTGKTNLTQIRRMPGRLVRL
nr:hypothetical protein [uncultured Blautia sp.]